MRGIFRGCLLASTLSLAGCSDGFTGAAGDRLPGSAQSLQNRPLSAPQHAVAGTKGFVIAGNAPAESFHLGYTALFKAHEPVYITADAILHALHSSFDHILTDIERASLTKELAIVVNGLREGLRKESEGSPEVRADLDLYLAVAASLESGKPATPIAGAQPASIAELVKKAEAADGEGEISLFGEPMRVDFSMMKPRGHYTSSPELQRYFRAMMWLGRTEIRIAEKKPDGAWLVKRRALEGTALLGRVFSERVAVAWRRIDDAMRAIVGPPDSMSFPGLDRAMKSLNVAALADLARAGDADVVRSFKDEAAQKIGSQLLYPGQPPIAFVPLGQRYVFDSHVLSEVTYGKLQAYRMMPSPLDVASAVFKNPAATELLKPDLDRFHYQGALDAIARRGDAMGADLWKGSLVHLWLGALRELSPRADRDADLPAVMKTQAWSRRLLNTQLASWAELRHDTLLYAKQSFTAMAICEYPDAYVEPYPSFFRAVEELAEKGEALAGLLELGSDVAMKARVASYFGKLRSTAAKLREMAELERRKEPLRPEHLDFINHAVSLDGKTAGCTTIWEPGGWYADLYYNRADIQWHKPIIADVHTQPTDEAGNMVGKVLHVATGKPRLFTVTIETCSGPRSYRGFVSSYHERITTDFRRFTDEEWREDMAKTPPPEVPWLSDIVAE